MVEDILGCLDLTDLHFVSFIEVIELLWAGKRRVGFLDTDAHEEGLLALR